MNPQQTCKTRDPFNSFYGLSEVLGAAASNFLMDLPMMSAVWETMSQLRAKFLQSQLLTELGSVTDLAVLDFQLRLDLTELHDVLVCDLIRENGMYERATSLAIRDRISPGDVFIDVGANNGYYSVLAALRCGSSGQVIALEPNPSAFTRLISNIRVNHIEKVVRPLQIAASDSDGKAILRRSVWEDGLSRLVGSESKGISVVTARLDRILSEHPSRFTCKIDTEGSEEQVLDGMKLLFQDAVDYVVVIEWNERYANEGLWNRLLDLGSIFEIETFGSGYRLVPVARYSSRSRRGLSNLWLQSRTSVQTTKPSSESGASRSSIRSNP
jgi:FkbM family methyltransferase